MRKFHVLVYVFIFTILTIAVFLVGCGGSDSGSNSGSSCAFSCPTNYLHCCHTVACCPAGYPYVCNAGGHTACPTDYCCVTTASQCDSLGGVRDTCI